MDFSAFLNGSRETVHALVALLTGAIAVLLGVAFMISGLKKVVAHGRGERQGQPTVGPVLINLCIGGAMVQLGTMTDMLVQTLFGTGRESPNSAMAYMPDPVQESQLLSQAVEAGVYWVAAIGFIAIIRGLVLWNELAKGAGHGQNLGWKGFWHLFFGALAVNIPGTLRMLAGG